MYGIETTGASAQAAAEVGLVFAESIVLYLGYGALDRTVGGTVLDALARE